MLQKKENNSTTNQINTIKTQGEVTEDSGSKTSATSVSTAVAGKNKFKKQAGYSLFR